MTRLVVPPGVAVVEEPDVVYIARLPGGPIAVLDGVAAVIWGKRAPVSARRWLREWRAGLEPPAADIGREVDHFVEGLIGHGFLVKTD